MTVGFTEFGVAGALSKGRLDVWGKYNLKLPSINVPRYEAGVTVRF